MPLRKNKGSMFAESTTNGTTSRHDGPNNEVAKSGAASLRGNSENSSSRTSKAKSTRPGLQELCKVGETPVLEESKTDGSASILLAPKVGNGKSVQINLCVKGGNPRCTESHTGIDVDVTNECADNNKPKCKESKASKSKSDQPPPHISGKASACTGLLEDSTLSMSIESNANDVFSRQNAPCNNSADPRLVESSTNNNGSRIGPRIDTRSATLVKLRSIKNKSV